MDNTIHWLNNYSADSMVCFVNTYPLDRDLSGGQRYPAFEQLGLQEENITFLSTCHDVLKDL